MKLLAVILFIVGAYSLPFDNETYRWKLIPDGSGRMHMNDENLIKSDPEPTFNPLEDVRYLLFTRENQHIGQLLSFDMNSVRTSNWNVNNNFRFIIHGWQMNANTAMNRDITRALLNSDDNNVIVVDWSAGADTTIYNQARQRVGPVGGALARLIDTMHAEGLIDYGRITIIGHGLGGHVAGFAGKQVTRGRISAIFANDPSLDGFDPGNPSQRLHITDAEYTETIHTDAGNNGFDQPITLASFWPNWGSNQPGCGVVDWGNTCSHERSNELYSESVNSLLNRRQFTARLCSGFVQIQNQNCPGIGSGIMGGDVAKPGTAGVFFLETNSRSPFAQG